MSGDFNKNINLGRRSELFNVNAFDSNYEQVFNVEGILARSDKYAPYIPAGQFKLSVYEYERFVITFNPLSPVCQPDVSYIFYFELFPANFQLTQLFSIIIIFPPIHRVLVFLKILFAVMTTKIFILFLSYLIFIVKKSLFDCQKCIAHHWEVRLNITR